MDFFYLTENKSIVTEWSGGRWDRGYLWKRRERRKVENVFTQGTWVSHSGGGCERRGLVEIGSDNLTNRFPVTIRRGFGSGADRFR
jgi:hypothetical protein